jgi:hypothetical protein
MSAGRQAFKLTEAARLMKAARLAGLTIFRVTTGRDGQPVLITDAGEASGGGPSVPPNP